METKEGDAKKEDDARGDVVVARSPEQEGVLSVKRVVGLPGDVLLTRDGRREAVPSDAVFLEGDNALNSNDSNAFGSVPASSIHARARLRIWPPSKAGVVARVEPREPGADARGLRCLV